MNKKKKKKRKEESVPATTAVYLIHLTHSQIRRSKLPFFVCAREISEHNIVHRIDIHTHNNKNTRCVCCSIILPVVDHRAATINRIVIVCLCVCVGVRKAGIVKSTQHLTHERQRERVCERERKGDQTQLK